MMMELRVLPLLEHNFKDWCAQIKVDPRVNSFHTRASHLKAQTVYFSHIASTDNHQDALSPYSSSCAKCCIFSSPVLPRPYSADRVLVQYGRFLSVLATRYTSSSASVATHYCPCHQQLHIIFTEHHIFKNTHRSHRSSLQDKQPFERETN